MTLSRHGLVPVHQRKLRARTVTNESLRRLFADIEESQSVLRYIHLATYPRTPALLTVDQVVRYNALRGFGSDICANVIQGHDPMIWRKHND